MLLMQGYDLHASSLTIALPTLPVDRGTGDPALTGTRTAAMSWITGTIHMIPLPA